MPSNLQSIALFYREGFRSMTVGRTLWKIILIKLIVLYALLKLFFPDYLQLNFITDQERAAHVLDNLTRIEMEKPVSSARQPAALNFLN